MKKAWIEIVPALACQREDVGVAQPFGVDRLAALDVGKRPQPVAVDGSELEVAPIGGFGHVLAETRLHARSIGRPETPSPPRPARHSPPRPMRPTQGAEQRLIW